MALCRIVIGKMSKSIPVRIELQSTQDGKLSVYEYRGELYHKDTALYVRYIEREESGEIRTLVKMSDGEIRIRRHGDVESEQTYVLNERRSGYYRVRGGTLPVETRTNRLGIERMEGKLVAEWSYSLYLAEEHAGYFNLRLTIQEEQL